jgi:hypothetical protein
MSFFSCHVTEHKNRDVVNRILQAQKASPKEKRKSTKQPKGSAARRSASIERIFEKKYEEPKPQVKQLKAQLNELREREHRLRHLEAAPPTAAAPPPPPPPPPGTAIRMATFGGPSVPASVAKARGPMIIAVAGFDIQNALKNLRKVRTAAELPPLPLDELVETLAQRREALAPEESSDSSDSDSESTQF